MLYIFFWSAILIAFFLHSAYALHDLYLEQMYLYFILHFYQTGYKNKFFYEKKLLKCEFVRTFLIPQGIRLNYYCTSIKLLGKYKKKKLLNRVCLDHNTCYSSNCVYAGAYMPVNLLFLLCKQKYQTVYILFIHRSYL